MATYAYDGLFRRVSKLVANQGTGPVYGSDGGGITAVQAGDRHEHYFYSGWRLVETTDHAEAGGAYAYAEASGAYAYADAHVLGQFVYGTHYLDEPVRYDRNANAYGESADNDCLDEGSKAYYYHQDANYRVVMLTGEDGQVVERYQYTAYGEPTVHAGYSTTAGAESASPLLVSAVGNPLMLEGSFFDRETGTHQNRERQLWHGRFMQRDVGAHLGRSSRYESAGCVASRGSIAALAYSLLPPEVWKGYGGIIRKIQDTWFKLGCLECAAAASLKQKITGEGPGKPPELDMWKKNDPTPDPDGCRYDAMQHCIGAAKLAKKCGVKCANYIGDKLEKDQENPSERDKHNNYKGASLCGGSSDVAKCCEDLLNSGQLNTKVDESDKKYSDCDKCH